MHGAASVGTGPQVLSVILMRDLDRLKKNGSRCSAGSDGSPPSRDAPAPPGPARTGCAAPRTPPEVPGVLGGLLAPAPEPPAGKTGVGQPSPRPLGDPEAPGAARACSRHLTPVPAALSAFLRPPARGSSAVLTLWVPSSLRLVPRTDPSAPGPPRRAARLGASKSSPPGQGARAGPQRPRPSLHPARDPLPCGAAVSSGESRPFRGKPSSPDPRPQRPPARPSPAPLGRGPRGPPGPAPPSAPFPGSPARPRPLTGGPAGQPERGGAGRGGARRRQPMASRAGLTDGARGGACAGPAECPPPARPAARSPSRTLRGRSPCAGRPARPGPGPLPRPRPAPAPAPGAVAPAAITRSRRAGVQEITARCPRKGVRS
ncbi:LOW QUALITY PROTEIN: basic proline-rich protein-like [Felis catus]|uniref:LOW QUALITY PROTEIN: basic proline-rich protein-like n=1 Tax=Felis catus TaxID=9685 RepID=UPI001D1A1F12|nr:LOW QUALITY PROTEIN: basic proline-rich protein-like [Felis catus]